MKRIFLLFFCTTLTVLPFFAQTSEREGQDSTSENTFSIDLQLRTRGEYNNGQGVPRRTGVRPAWYVGDRERLSMNFRRKGLSAKISGQHAGVWGDSPLSGTGSNFLLHEVWARLDGKAGWYVQVGRQVLSYDDERIFGAEDWSATGFTHDAARIGYQHGSHTAEGIVAYNQERERYAGGTYYDGAMPYKTLQFLWYHYAPKSNPLQLSAMFLNQGTEIGKKSGMQESARTGYMQMLGAWARYNIADFYAKAEIYYQLGHDQDQRRMSATLFSLRGGYAQNNWGGEMGFDYASGSKISLRRGTNKCFNLLYGSSHDFFGSMDYFVPGRMVSCGLMDLTLKGYFQPMEQLRIEGDYHGFWMATPRKNFERSLGHEIDLSATYNLSRDVMLQAGYSLYLPKRSTTYFLSGSWNAWQDWAWLSLSFSPRIFSARWK